MHWDAAKATACLNSVSGAAQAGTFRWLVPSNRTGSNRKRSEEPCGVAPECLQDWLSAATLTVGAQHVNAMAFTDHSRRFASLRKFVELAKVTKGTHALQHKPAELRRTGSYNIA